MLGACGINEENVEMKGVNKKHQCMSRPADKRLNEFVGHDQHIG
jgi:hypothetical protein